MRFFFPIKELKQTVPRPGPLVKLPAVGEDYKVLKQLGDCIISERFSKGTDSAKVADEYRRICRKQKYDRLPQGGYLLFEAVAETVMLQRRLNFIFLSLPNTSSAYTLLARNFRKARRFEDAVRIAMLGTAWFEQRRTPFRESSGIRGIGKEG